MLRTLYSLLHTLLLPFLLLRLLRRSAVNSEYRRRWRERLGRPALSRLSKGPLVWVHAVSVGESLVARALVQAWREENPELEFLVTTTTPTGSELVQNWQPSVLHQHMPFDLVSMHRSLLMHYKPQLIVLMETEVWPNLIHLANKVEIPVVLANARMSQKSMRGYNRFQALTRPAFKGLSRVLAQSSYDAERIISLGASSARTQVTGTIKYDMSLSAKEEAALVELRESFGQRPVVVAGSLHPGEEDVVLNAFRSIQVAFPRLVIVIAPRHQERFAPMAEKLASLNLGFAQRSKGEVPSSNESVWLLDTLGELKVFYGLAKVALVGGSWVDRGSHNPLEPAMLGVPVITGPSVFNFVEASDLLVTAGAMRVTTARDLHDSLLIWLRNDNARHRAGQAGRAVVAANQGATARQVAALEALRK